MQMKRAHAVSAPSLSTNRTALMFGLALAIAAAAVPDPLTAQRAPSLDVPFVPTPPEVVEKMLDLGEVGPGDYVIDLGSGDGRIAIAAAKRGAKALGIDLNPVRVQEARENAKKEGVEGRVEFREQNLFDADISDADVLTMYLLSGVNIKLRPRILKELEPGTRVVSHAFDMGDWQPDQVEKVDGRTVYLWTVPAKVEGTWKVKNGGKNFTVTFDQDYQEVKGTAEIDGKEVPVQNVRLEGDRLTFTLEAPEGTQKFIGRVSEDKIEPVQEQAGAQAVEWEASRAS